MRQPASSSLHPVLLRALGVAAWLAVAASTATTAWAAGVEDGGGYGGAAQLDDPDFAAGRDAAKAKDWKAVVAKMDAVVGRHPKNADAWNFLGYAWRHLGDMNKSFTSYKRALQLDPVHVGAHEYIGEAYLKVGDVKSAEWHLKELERICSAKCEEYADLKAKLAEHGKPRTEAQARQ